MKNNKDRQINMNKAIQRDSEVATRVKRTAILVGVSERYVYHVLNGERNSEEVLNIYMQLQEGEQILINAVKELIPFN
jgi:hypothetical protein